jgi:hypothetical protein
MSWARPVTRCFELALYRTVLPFRTVPFCNADVLHVAQSQALIAKLRVYVTTLVVCDERLHYWQYLSSGVYTLEFSVR